MLKLYQAVYLLCEVDFATSENCHMVTKGEAALVCLQHLKDCLNGERLLDVYHCDYPNTKWKNKGKKIYLFIGKDGIWIEWHSSPPFSLYVKWEQKKTSFNLRVIWGVLIIPALVEKSQHNWNIHNWINWIKSKTIQMGDSDYTNTYE